MARGRVSLTRADAAAPRVEFNFTGHELDLQALHAGLPPRRRRAGARQGSRDQRRHLSGEVQRPAAAIQPHQHEEQGAERVHRRADRSGAAARRADLSTLADRRVDLAKMVEDDDALAEHIRDNVAGTFHPVGTCRMGAADDRDAVTDTTGRVRGVDGLRVIDASLMPTIPRGNTNIPTIMVAEKIAEAMLREMSATDWNYLGTLT